MDEIICFKLLIKCEYLVSLKRGVKKEGKRRKVKEGR
jgi:hypothetical protein